MRAYHIYGRERTDLRLTDKAERAYSGGPDAMEIREYSDRVEDPETDRLTTVYAYTLVNASGEPESARMTADELNAELEAIADGQDAMLAEIEGQCDDDEDDDD